MTLAERIAQKVKEEEEKVEAQRASNNENDESNIDEEDITIERFDGRALQGKAGSGK